MEEVRVDYSKYRMETAKKCLLSSRTAFDLEDFLTSLNRSYYAIFHAIRAVTILDHFDSKKHSCADYQDFYMAGRGDAQN